MAEPVRTMVVWCLDWPVVAAGVDPGSPVAVVHANRVVASSAAARQLGVQRGLRRREAQGRCPELVVIERDPAREARLFEPVVSAVETFTPRIEITRPGRCRFATRGPSRYFGGDDSLAGAVHERVTGVLTGRTECRIGVADGPFAAEQAARSGSAATTGVWIVAPGASAGFLAPLPITSLGRPELTDVFSRLGVRRLGDLAALPAPSVLGRFGTEGAIAHRLASGLDEERPDAHDPPADLEAAAEIDPPAERVDQVAFVGRALADQLHQALDARRSGLHPGGDRGRDRARGAPGAALAPRGQPRRRGPSPTASDGSSTGGCTPRLGPPAGSPASPWSPTRWWPPGAASSASGVARPRPTSGRNGRSPASRPCWAPTRSGSPSGRAGGRPASSWPWCRPRPSIWSSAPSATNRAPTIRRGRVVSRRRRRRGCIPIRCRRGWSAGRVLWCRSPPGVWRRRLRASCRSATRRPGRSSPGPARG